MASITFTGDPNAPGTDPASIEMFGIEFPLNKAVEVEDAKIAERLSRHSHFSGDFEPKPTKADHLAKARAAKAAKAAM